MTVTERGEEAGDHVLAGGGDRRQPQLPTLGVERLGRRRLGRLQQREHLAGVAGEDHARRRDDQAPTRPFNQGHAELPLERPDGGRDRRLADEERTGAPR